MNPLVRFEDEGDAEYRQAGRWYESRRTGLGIEFFNAVDAAIRQIVDFPGVGAMVPRVPGDLPVRRLAVARFPYHVVYLGEGDDGLPNDLRGPSRRMASAGDPHTADC